MKKQKLYTYIGLNGTITSSVLLEGASRIEKYELQASAGKILTNGEKKAINIVIPAIEIDEWYEIDAGQ